MRPIPLLLLLATLPLPGCSNDDSGPPAPPSGTAAITTENVELAASTALHAALGIAPVAANAGGAIEPSPVDLNWRTFALQRFGNLLLPQRALLATITLTRNGQGGGTATIQWEDNDNNEEVTSGDTFAIVFAAYVENGLSLDGNLLVDQLEVLGSLEADLAWTIRCRYTFDGFTYTNINSSAPPRAVAGVLGAEIEQRPTVTLLTVQPITEVTTADATISTGSTVHYDEFNTSQYRITSTGAVGHPQLEGTVAFGTSRAFTAFVWEQYPTAGELMVTGGNTAVIRVTARDTGDVLLETDLDGDGTYDESTPVAWSELGF